MTPGAGTVLSDAKGNRLGVAFAKGRYPVWKTYATLTKRGREIAIETLDGKHTTCRIPAINPEK